MSSQNLKDESQRKLDQWDAVDESSAESFPASDPPAHRVEKMPPKSAAESLAAQRSAQRSNTPNS